ncbi:MAG: formate--phosphoribosylaminoimidazolecarboxamide ligase family protein [Candidatus Diapherotrites archaeon]|nr:formate--phosphoribosylaminoimidazolecarboxamide ligase family protein [Candidatus Diapherotrites archaeon]
MESEEDSIKGRFVDKDDLLRVLESYDTENLAIGVVGSHSALDVCDGAIDEGFKTLAVCQKGREKTYSVYFKSRRNPNTGVVEKGFVDEVMVLDRFSEILSPRIQKQLIEKNTLFVPNRSFSSYCSMDAIERDFAVPMVGSRNMLRSEERGEQQDYYWILERAGLPFPEKITDPKDINELSIIKLPHAVKKLERGFFTASSFEEYTEKSESLISQGVIAREALESARMERYVIGPVFNLDFFYSPLSEGGLELLGVDWRFESSLDGHVRLPADQQLALNESQKTPEYTVCGHNSATLRESLLEKAFELGEKYVDAAKKHYSPGIIGAFCLQTCVDKDLNYHIYDVAPRVGGGTNVHMAVGHPYANSVWRTSMSTGRRTALEIRRALEMNELEKIIT